MALLKQGHRFILIISNVQSLAASTKFLSRVIIVQKNIMSIFEQDLELLVFNQ